MKFKNIFGYENIFENDGHNICSFSTGILPKEGPMYALYPFGLLAGFLMYFVLKYMDDQDLKKAEKIH